MKLNEHIEDIVEMYLKGKSCPEISKKFNCTSNAILYQLKKRKITRRTNSQINRKYTLNENFFNKINNQNKAYILGLLYADGYNFIKENKVVLQLHKQDKQILEEISKKIKSNKPLQEIKVKNNLYYRMSINSKTISMNLLNNGCGQSKTFKIKFPNNISDNLMNHFIRGYFDGDGCIYVDKKGQPEFSITGNYDFINDIHKYLNNALNLNDVILKKKNNSFTIRYRGKNICNKIKNYIYKNSKIYFLRKFEKFNSY